MIAKIYVVFDKGAVLAEEVLEHPVHLITLKTSHGFWRNTVERFEEFKRLYIKKLTVELTPESDWEREQIPEWFAECNGVITRL